MKILDRYVFREFLIPLFYCLGGFISIYVLFELFGSFSRLAEAKLPLMTTVEYFCAYLAPYFEYLAPAALMLAALYTMWNFCRHSELIAMRANGIGFVTIVRPILLVAVAMAAFVFWVNDEYVPRRAQWAQSLRTAKFDSNAAAKMDNIVFCNELASRTWMIDRLRDDAPEHLADVRVICDRPNGGARLLSITSPKVDYLDGEWWFTDPKVQHFGADGKEIPSPTPELDALKQRVFPEFKEHPADFLVQNRTWKYNSISDRLRFLKTHPNLSKELRRKYTYETWAKILAPLACLVITLFAIPAGIASGRQSVFKGILGAIGMFLAYYMLVIGCMVFANLGLLPGGLAALLPNVVFLAVGGVMFYRQR